VATSAGDLTRDAAYESLAGIRVVDLSQNLAGPYCAQILADLGADVVKVEPPGGDPARAWGPPFEGGQAVIFGAANRGKRSLVLNLKQSQGADVLARLLRGADVFLQSFRRGVIERLGFGWEELRLRHPRLVYCSVTAYGAEGPLRDLPGYDPLMQAHGGLVSVTGHTDQPARVGTSVVDMGTGMWTAIAVLAALRERDRTGQGTHVVSSLYETTLSWMAYHLAGWHADGTVPVPRGASFPLIAPYDAFPTADGRLMIAAANDGLFERLCVALELRGLAEDARFADNPARVAHRVELGAALADATRGLSTAALLDRLRRAGVPCAPIQDVAQVARDPQTLASAVVRRTARSAGQDFTSVALPLRWDGRRAAHARPAPHAGAHTRELLHELGYDADSVRRLSAAGAVRIQAEAEPS
jgi:crotonobetainyl-CoA:carnitine CoA-transferase CaiB-like acyl-CoA transferase